MTELKALLFDVDGTLADTESVHLAAFNQAFADAGLDWHWSPELYLELLAVTGGRERMRFYLDRYNKEWPRPDSLDEFIADLHKAKTAHYTRMVREGDMPLRSGVLRLIQEARSAGLRLAIATTTTPANVTALLEANLPEGGVEWFEEIAAGSVVPAKKPAPDIYEYALDRMGLRPEECLAIEDSENGIRSSLAARVPTVITLNDFTRGHDFSGALLVTDGLGEPDAPMQVISGDAGGAGFVDVALLRRLHAEAVA
jgi:HAD superfamily hydrolase (TIGR01509 family)